MFSGLGRIHTARPAAEGLLKRVGDFGPNPGNLSMYAYAPERPAAQRACVVVLHGCTQTALGFDAAAGWSRLAETHGFAVVYAEQKASNNDQTCFSWFQPDDVRRGSGEVASIREMVAWAVGHLGVDPRRVFACGLSAGGAMATAALATYPEVFAGGAIIAGLPYGAARNVSSAFEAMSQGRVRDPAIWGDAVREASGHAGCWPDVAIWQATGDKVVRPINAGELVKQWTDVHGVGASHPELDHVGPAARRTWRDANGRACVREYMLEGLGHGAPVDDLTPPAPFFLPSGLSSTRQIAEDFGLLRETGVQPHSDHRVEQFV